MTDADLKPVLVHMSAALLRLRDLKPGDRSQEDRHVAMCISEIEKTIALVDGLLSDRSITHEFINE